MYFIISILPCFDLCCIITKVLKESISWGGKQKRLQVSLTGGGIVPAQLTFGRHL